MPLISGRNLAAILQSASSQFSLVLRSACEVSGITRAELSRRSAVTYGELVESGYSREICPCRGFSETEMQMIWNGDRMPDRIQVLVFAQVLEQHFTSHTLADICARIGLQLPQYTPAVKSLLWHFAGYLEPEELQKVLQPPYSL